MRLLRTLQKTTDNSHMHFGVTSDANAESGVGGVVNEISGLTRMHFKTKNYGAGLSGIGIVLMCRNPELKFKQRIRLSKKDKILYMDIMLDLDEMKHAAHKMRKFIIIERLANEVPAVLSRYTIPDFDDARFVEDLRIWLKEIAQANK